MLLRRPSGRGRGRVGAAAGAGRARRRRTRGSALHRVPVDVRRLLAPGFHNYWKAEYVTGLTDESIEQAARYALAHSSPLSDFKFAALGGAVARVGEDETATGFRDAPFVLNINTRWADAAESERHITHTRELYDAFLPSSAGGVYVNFLGDEGEERVRAAYGDARYARLQELKRRYDPDNVFRLNQNIPPAAS